MPEVAKQWDYEKNGDIKPEYIPCTSHKKFYWKCKKGHSWKAQVNTRLMGHGCPYCAGIILAPGENDLLSQNPELVKEWDYERNGSIKPEFVSRNSRHKYFWICSSFQIMQDLIRFIYLLSVILYNPLNIIYTNLSSSSNLTRIEL